VDADTEAENHEENGKCGVLADEDGCESSHICPSKKEDPVEIADVCTAGQLGPVSPPVLGEDLSKRGLYHVKLPSDKEYSSSEEKSDLNLNLFTFYKS
jgi:hypothetical protein